MSEGDVFPTAAELDLDMWKAQAVNPDGSRYIEGVAGSMICAVYGTGPVDATRDMHTRRVEMIGDVYEALRRAAEKMSAAGLDVDSEQAVLGDFIAPKPFKEA